MAQMACTHNQVKHVKHIPPLLDHDTIAHVDMCDQSSNVRLDTISISSSVFDHAHAVHRFTRNC